MLAPGTPAERTRLLSPQGLRSPSSSPLTPVNYGSTPRANGVPRGMGRNFQGLPERFRGEFHRIGRRVRYRAIRAFQSFHARRGGLRTISRVVRRRLFATPLAASVGTAALEAAEASVIYAAYFSAMNWILLKLGVDKIIAKWTTVDDWSLGSDDVPKDKQDNDHSNSMFGDGDPRAPCMPTREFPNAFSLAMGSPIAVSA